MIRSLAISALLISALAEASGTWREALPGYRYQFPRDHFGHPEFRTEWWYYTGNVQSDDGRRYGFELVFFRQGHNRQNEANLSAWRVDDMYLAHAALTDVSGKRFLYKERLNRAGPGIAGTSVEQRRIWNGNWNVQWKGDEQELSALTPDFQFTLRAQPLKPLVIHGVDGVSQKAVGLGMASHYVSFPRLDITGSISTGGRIARVQGQAWMDHEWFTHTLSPEQQGWNWFSIQLNDKTEFMLYDFLRKDGSIDPNSAGTFVDAAGIAHHLTRGDFRLTPLDRWHGYPVHWRVEIPSRKVDLDCRAVLDSQAISASKGGTSYWEGAVDYSGTHRGVGYLEMTGYAGAVKLD